MANRLAFGRSAAPVMHTDDGLDFNGWIQPPEVPPDPVGDEWRGEPGPPGPPGPGAAPSDAVPLMDGTGAAGTLGTASRGDHVHPSDTSRLPLTGGTLSNALTINSGTDPTLYITSTSGVWPGVILDGLGNYIGGSKSGIWRWEIDLGDGSAETGGNAGSNFGIARYDDAGNQIGDYALAISRATGAVALTGSLTIQTDGDPTLFIKSANNWPGLALDSPAGNTNYLYGSRNNLGRWEIDLGEASPETGGNAGSDFQIYRFDDAGHAIQPATVYISRATGAVTLSGALTVTGNLSAPVLATGSLTSRLLSDRAHDWINVKDYGAVLDGTTNDTPAWAAARAAALDFGTITVPRGRQFVNTAPTGGPTTPVLWKYDGDYIGSTGTTPVIGMGTDTVETFIGSKYFGRANGYINAVPVVRIDNVLNHTTGTSSSTNNTFLVNTTASGTTGNFSYGITSQLTASRATGGNSVALAGYASRTVNGPAIFGGNLYARDITGNASSLSGSALGVELDVLANGDDDGGVGDGNYVTVNGQGVRAVVDVVAGKGVAGGADCVVGWGVRVGPTSGTTTSSFKRSFAAYGKFSIAAFSTEYAAEGAGANAVWLKTGHHIALDTAGTGGAANVRLSSDGTTATLTGALGVTGPLKPVNGLDFGSVIAGTVGDFSKHISLYAGWGGINITSGRLNVVAQGQISLVIGTTDIISFDINNFYSYKPINLPADPTAPLHAATKQYVDARVGGSGYLPTTGGTMTGALILAADPATALGAATKQYADKMVPLAGGTMTGLLLLSADPAAALGASTKQYVDAKQVGTATNDNAAAGRIGEYLSATRLAGSSVALTTGVSADILALSLTAGDWDVAGNLIYTGAGGVSLISALGWINTASATLPVLPNGGMEAQWVGTPPTTNVTPYLSVGRGRISIAVTTIIYLSTSCQFSGGTVSGYGFIGARRAR